MVISKIQIVTALGVTTLVAAAGGIYYLKYKKKPDASPDGGGRRITSRDSKNVFFADKDTDAMSISSLGYFGYENPDWRYGKGIRGARNSIGSIKSASKKSSFNIIPKIKSSLSRPNIPKPDSFTKPPTSPPKSNFSKDAAGCSCRVTSCNKNDCTCGEWNNLSSRDRGLKSSAVLQRSPRLSARSSPCSPKVSCKCSSNLSARKARWQERFK